MCSHLSAEEESIRRRNPKFDIQQNLQEYSMREKMEKAYSLIRLELREEEEEETKQSTGEQDENEMNENKRMEKELEAKERQVFCPVEKRYDERKRRVTDLVEYSRVTLPKTQTWKKIKSFRGRVLSTIKISATNISLNFSH